MYPRNLQSPLRQLAQHYPVVTVTGPRQSGKTTLCRGTFPEKAYVSLEPLDDREFARSDPRGFLAQYAGGAIIDEVQHAPDLLSYLQAEVDLRPEHGRFILTGSQHFGLSQAIAQSLAGRTGVLQLLPLSLDELRGFPNPPAGLFETLWAGGYPRIHDQGIPPARWLADYVTTYVERDVRQVLNVGDLQAFTTFLKLCAGRTAQTINLSSLGGDAGVSHNTAKAWLSVLEASFVCLRLPAWHRNLGTSAVKAAKLHFVDTGLACHLLGIQSADQLLHHPQRGAIFESWVAAEVYKARVHRGLPPSLFHYRDPRGAEVDVVLDTAAQIDLIEAKSGATLGSDFFKALESLADQLTRGGERRLIERWLVYGGDGPQRRSVGTAIPWSAIQDEDWAR
jgi:predicted AAA+ superfamily ATPase